MTAWHPRTWKLGKLNLKLPSDQAGERAKRQASFRASEAKKAKSKSGEGHVARLLCQAGVDNVAPKLAKAVVSQLLVLLELAGFVNDVVVSWVLGQGRQEKCTNHGLEVWDKEVRKNIATGIELLYLGVPFAMVAAALDCAKEQLSFLSKYVVEYNLWQWLLHLNCDKGVRPENSELLTQACRYIPACLPEVVAASLRGFFLASDSNGARSARRWVASFRQKWDVKVGLLQLGVDIEPTELQSKVSWLD